MGEEFQQFRACQCFHW